MNKKNYENKIKNIGSLLFIHKKEAKNKSLATRTTTDNTLRIRI